MEEVFTAVDIAAAFVAGGFVAGVLQRIHLNNRLAGITPVAEVEEIRPRRARRMDDLDLRHRKPDPDEDELGTDTTLDEPVEGEIVTARGDMPARQRFVGLVAGSSDPGQRRHLDPNWTRTFATIAAALRDDTDPSDAATPLFHATGLALLGPTGHYPVYAAATPQPQRLVEVDGPDPERIAATRAMHLAATRGGTDDDVMPVPTTPPTANHPMTPDAPPPPPAPVPSPRTVGAAA